jgi:hypothetical protein
MEEKKNEGGFKRGSMMMTADSNSIIAKEQQEKTKKLAFDSLSKSDNFILITRKEKVTEIISGIHSPSIPYFLEAMERWAKSIFKSSFNHMFPGEKLPDEL